MSSRVCVPFSFQVLPLLWSVSCIPQLSASCQEDHDHGRWSQVHWGLQDRGLQPKAASSISPAPCTVQNSLFSNLCCLVGFLGGSAGKESTCNVEDLGSIPELGRSPEEGNGYSLQYSCLENSMEGGAQQFTVHSITKSQKLSLTLFQRQVRISSFSSKQLQPQSTHIPL